MQISSLCFLKSLRCLERETRIGRRHSKARGWWKSEWKALVSSEQMVTGSILSDMNRIRRIMRIFSELPTGKNWKFFALAPKSNWAGPAEHALNSLKNKGNLPNCPVWVAHLSDATTRRFELIWTTIETLECLQCGLSNVTFTVSPQQCRTTLSTAGQVCWPPKASNRSD